MLRAVQQFLLVGVVPHANEGVVRVFQDAVEKVWDGGGVEEREDEAAAADAELEDGGRRLGGRVVGGAPLDA